MSRVIKPPASPPLRARPRGPAARGAVPSAKGTPPGSGALAAGSSTSAAEDFSSVVQEVGARCAQPALCSRALEPIRRFAAEGLDVPEPEAREVLGDFVHDPADELKAFELMEPRLDGGAPLSEPEVRDLLSAFSADEQRLAGLKLPRSEPRRASRRHAKPA